MYTTEYAFKQPVLNPYQNTKGMLGEGNLLFDQHVTNVIPNDEYALKSIIQVFSMNIPSDSFLFTSDPDLTAEFFVSLPKEKYITTSSIIFDFQSSLQNTSENPTLAEILRKMIAIGFYTPQLYLNPHLAGELYNLVHLFKHILFKDQIQSQNHRQEMSFSLGYLLYSISIYFTIIDFGEKLNDFLTDIFDIYLSKDFLDKDLNSAQFFFLFYISALSNMKFDQFSAEEENQIFSNLVKVIILTLSFRTNLIFPYLTATKKIISYLKAPNLALVHKIQLINLLSSLSSSYADASKEILKEDSISIIVGFIYSYLDSLNIEIQYEEPEKALNLEEITSKSGLPASDLQKPFFNDQPYKHLTSDETAIHTTFKEPDVPDIIANSKEINVLMIILSRLFQTVHNRSLFTIHILFFKTFIHNNRFCDTPIPVFFVTKWINTIFQIPEKDKKGGNNHKSRYEDLAQALHDISFLSRMLKTSFFVFNNEVIKKYTIEVLIHLISISYHIGLFLEFIDVVEEALHTARFDIQLMNCLSIITSLSNDVFIKGCQQKKLTFSKDLIMYQNIDLSKCDDVERIQNNRRLLLNLLEKLSADRSIFEYLFTKKDYHLAVLSHFYDVSTADFAVAQITVAIIAFNANIPSVRYIFKYIATKLFRCHELPETILYMIIEFCIEGFKINPLLMSKIFSESHFLKTLIDFSIEIEATNCIEIVLELLSCIFQQAIEYSPNISIFLKLSPLVKSAKNMSLDEFLFKIIFYDDLKMTKVRKIINPGPLSLLFQIYKDDDKHLSEFLSFLDNCFDVSMFEITQTNLSLQLIQYISEYRKKTEKDELFAQVLAVLQKNMMYSISPNALLSFFQLFTIILPDKIQPFYTIDLLNTLIRVFKNRKTTTLTFFHFESEDHGISLPVLPCDIFNDSFSLIMKMCILETKGTIFQFCSDNDYLCLSFSSDGYLIFNGDKLSIQLPTSQWIKFTFRYSKSGYVEFLINDQSQMKLLKKFEFKEPFFSNSVVQQLKSNVEFVRFETNKSIYFEFNPYSFCQKYAVYQNCVALLEGSVYHLPPPPKVILNQIGGAAIIIPLLAQIELFQDSTKKPLLLLTILTLLEEILFDSSLLQSNFYSNDGFRMMGELLSILPIDIFTNDTALKLLGIFSILTDKLLQKQMIEFVLLNMNIWVYITPIQQFYFGHLFTTLIELIQNDKSFLSIINVKSMLYLMKCYLYTNIEESTSLDVGPKITVDGKVLAQRPNDLQILREQFVAFILQIAETQLTWEELFTILHFSFHSFDTSLQSSAIMILARLISSQNKFIFSYLSNTQLGTSPIRNVFYHYFDFLKTSNGELLNSLFFLFDATSADVLNIPRSKLNYIILTRLEPASLNIAFLEHLEKLPLKLDLKIPIFLYILTAMPEINKVPEKFKNFLENKAIQQLLPNNQYFFYCFFITCFLNAKFNEILETLLRDFIPICLNHPASFSNFLLFIQLIEYECRLDKHDTSCDLSQLFRLFLLIASEFFSSNFKTTINSFIVNAFRFLFKIPLFDRFSRIVNGLHSTKALSYLDILNLLTTKSQIDIHYCYGLRLTMENVWVDYELSLKIIDLIINHINFIENPGNQMLELLTILISTGIQLNDESFIKKSDVLVSLFCTHKELLSDHVIRNSFVILIGSFARLYLKGNSSIYDRIESILSEFDNIPFLIFKIKSKNATLNDLIPLFVENLCEIEENIEKQMELVNSINLSNFLFETASIVQPMTIKTDRIDESIKLYSNSKNKSKQESMKKYKQLFQSLSTENGPWTNRETPPVIHYKLDINFSKRTRLIPNLKFTIHREASLARNLGSSKDAQQIVRDQIAKMKLQSFSGDFSLIEFDDNETTKTVNTESIDNVILTCQCQMITTKKVHNGYLNLTNSTIVFDSASKYVKINLNKVKRVLLRRYLQDNTAIEVFSEFSRVYFFQFQNGKERSLFLNKLSSLKIPSIKLIQKRNDEAFKMAKIVTDKWQRGEISNCTYLLELNIIAGRSFNDISQYPVFPWVLCDYQSETIDLSDPKVYRDLSIPIGAYTQERLEYMQIKMQEAISDETRYLYGSFYSSSAVVIGYLIRMEPFTSLHIKLQNGRFDIPDRLFTSIPSAWESVTTNQMDFRELIPEFFLIPDFLNNTNQFDLGISSTREPVNDVKLPPWAKSARHFIEINRQALESPIVSSTLHSWIDLIFGPHSRLPLSVEVNNVFHPYFYDSAMDNLSKIEPSQRELTRTLIKEYAACFGFGPSQIFEKFPEPKTKIPIPHWPVIRFNDYTTIFSFAGTSPVKTVFAGDYLIATTQDLQYVVMKVDVMQSTTISYGKFNVIVPAELKNIVPIVSASRKYVALTVPWTTHFLLFAFQKHVYSLIGSYANGQHISALSISRHYLAAASNDCTLRTWRIRKERIDDSNNTKHSTNLNDVLEPVSFLAKHIRPISFVEICEKLNSVYSISDDGLISCISLSDGRYLHGIELELSDPSAFFVTKSGYVLVAFNGPDFALLVVLDSNLEEITRTSLDGSLKCWTTCTKGGIEYLAIILKSQAIQIGELPYWRKTADIFDVPSIECVSFIKKPVPKLVFGSTYGELMTIDLDD